MADDPLHKATAAASIIARLLDEAEKARRKGHLLLAEVCRDASDALGLAQHEAERWKAQAFQPLGDNHHNALLCPHCNPEGRRFA